MSKTPQRGLGRGLDALFHNAASEEVRTVPIGKITPNRFQPRKHFDEDALAELSESVRQYGVLQPIVVRRTMTGYELVAGERRWRASQQAGLKEIPAVVRDYTDGEMTEIALIENLQRENLNPIEEAEAYKRLMEEFGLTQEEVARKIGRSRSLIANTLRLLNLPVGVQQHVSMGLLTTGQIRPILALPTEALQEEAAQTILEQELSARDAEEWVRRLMAGQKERKPRQQSEIVPDVYWQDAEDRLQNRLGTKVRIKPGKLKSKIEIEFYSQEDLERLLELMQEQQNLGSFALKQQGPFSV